MAFIVFITHPEVTIDPAVPVPDWPLSSRGLERMSGFCDHPFVARIRRIFASEERKARDGAEILAQRLGLEPEIHAGLGENDRSATGYLPMPEFLEVAELFFAHPEKSIRGWERAVDAQRRVTGAVRDVANRCRGQNAAIISHGGVGTLLMCHLRRHPISLSLKPPVPEGGSYFALDADSFELIHGWLEIERMDSSMEDLPQQLEQVPRDPQCD